MRPGIGAGEAPDGTLASPDASPAKKTSTNAFTGPQGLGVWIGGAANFGAFDSYRQAAGFDSDNIAVTAGVDQRIGNNSLFGLAVGYNHDNSEISNDGTRSVAQGYSAAMYGSFAPSEHTYIDGVLGGGGLSFDSARHGENVGDELLGHRYGDQWFASLTGGYEYKYQSWLLTPYGSLEWSLSRLNSFSETGDVTEALTYGSELVRTTQALLGLRASTEYKEDWGLIIPHARIEFGHEFQGVTSTTLSYALIPSAGSWNILSNPYSANGNSVQLGLGSDLKLQGNWLITTEYDYLVQPHSHDQMIKLGVKKQF
jgi:outer membrane autotransporter protein